MGLYEFEACLGHGDTLIHAARHSGGRDRWISEFQEESEFQDSQDYTKKLCLKKKKRRERERDREREKKKEKENGSQARPAVWVDCRWSQANRCLSQMGGSTLGCLTVDSLPQVREKSLGQSPVEVKFPERQQSNTCHSHLLPQPQEDQHQDTHLKVTKLPNILQRASKAPPHPLPGLMATLTSLALILWLCCSGHRAV